MEHEVRPWGQYWVLEDSDTHKVKRIEVYPNERLSYQFHNHRSEVWTIIKGVATITLDDEIKMYQPGDVIIIPQGTKHRIANQNNETCTFIEVQYGTYFGEDDITRLEDDYHRN